MKKLFLILLCAALFLTACAAPQSDTNSEATVSDGAEEIMDETADETEDKAGKLIALTFDDGPNTTTMVEVLDLLEEYDAVATFFLIGNYINDDTAPVLNRALEMGCELGNHTWSHGYTSKLDADGIKEEIEKTQKKVYEVTGVIPEYFRPPYYDVSQTMYDVIDLPFIGGFGAQDWEASVSAEERTKLFFEACGEGKIAVLHCFTGNSNTVEALKSILPRLLEEGYDFVTVSELFAAYDTEPKAHNGVLYATAEDTK